VITTLKQLSTTLPPQEQQAMQRRIDQLTMAYIYNIIMDTRSRHYLERKLNLLKRHGLFPLPDKDYTKKYTWFRKLTNSKIGLAFLMRTLPLINRER
jgi:hypothetical protein